MRNIDEIIAGSEPRPAIIAHRGASHYYHENTMEAFEAAVDMRAEMLEFDVHRTADGVLVVHHDSDIGGTLISEMFHEEVCMKASDSGYEIPTLAAVLQYCSKKIPVDIELKEGGYEEQALTQILGVLDVKQFIVTSLHGAVIRKVKDLQSDVRTGLILSSRPRWQLMTKLYPEKKARNAGADVLVVSRKLLKLGFLSATRDLEIPLWVYIVNDRHDLWKMIMEKRVSAIFSDRPDVALLMRDLHAAGQKSIPGIEEGE